MKAFLSSLIALAFMLPTAPSHAFNPQGGMTINHLTWQNGVTGYTLVAQCKLFTPGQVRCSQTMKKSMRTIATNIRDNSTGSMYRDPFTTRSIVTKTIEKLNAAHEAYKACMSRC